MSGASYQCFNLSIEIFLSSRYDAAAYQLASSSDAGGASEMTELHSALCARNVTWQGDPAGGGGRDGWLE